MTEDTVLLDKIQKENSMEEIKQVFAENLRLSNEIRASQAEKDDLSRRLQISLQKIQELNKQINDQKNIHSQIQEDCIKSYEKQKENDEIQFQKKINCLKTALSEKEKTIQSFDAALNTYQYQIDQICNAASSYFGKTINDAESVIKLLLLPKDIDEQPPITQPPPEPIIIKKESKKAKLYEEKLNESEQLRKDNEAAFIRKIDSIVDTYEKKLKERESNIQDLNLQIRSLKEKLEQSNDLKGEMLKNQSKEKVQYQLSVNELEAQKLEEISKLTKKVNNLEENLQKEQDKSELLKKQLVITMKKYKSTAKQYDDLNSDFEKLKSTERQLNNENKQLILKVKQLESNISDANADLLSYQKKNEELSGQNRAYLNDLNQRAVDLEKMKVTLSHYLETNNQVKSEIATANSDKQKHMEQLNDSIKLIEQKEKQIQELNNQLTELRKENNSVKLKLTTLSQPIKEDELIPLACWSCSLFPKELQNILSDLARNRTIQAPTKLRHYLTMIAEWYNNQIDRVESEISKIKIESEKSNIMKKEFAQSMKTLLPTYDIDFTKIIDCCEERQKFVNFIQKTQINLNLAKASSDEKEAQLSGLLVAMQASSPEEAHSFIGSMSEEVNNLNDDVEKTLRKMEKQKAKFESIEKDLKQQIDDSNKQIDNLKALLKNSEDSFEQIKRKSKSEKFEFSQKIQDYEHKIHELELINEAKVAELQNANAQSLELMGIEKKKNVSFTEEIEKQKEENEQLKETIQMLTKQKNKAIKDMKEEVDQKQDQYKMEQHKLQSEITLLKEQISKVVDEYKLQIEDYKSSIAALSESKVAVENKNNEILSNNSNLQSERQKLLLQIQSLKNEIEREKRLSETQIKAKESQLLAEQNRINESMRVKSETEKQNIFSKVANEFCTLFDVSTTRLNESNFDMFLSNIRNKLNELLTVETKLRLLLALGPQQSIVDAVSQLLLSS
ncbi:hypothetical protein TVAG_470150 [Trichomonas vaginalis G3]|uniref:Uncharacterized protein n=1 Tax=Trichomonas vaginalis (strain ATCC PRA-98 / G3) TaxID=412133 RepID=A2FE22_TRIV3|nr:A-type inclusion protein-related family [Trichomonas vaginalis G3]EAX96850.1 hypothetical protein TVAG_470150 [Trichomonas vaginalis G3]KAI5520685.1 A-type inclusion protein-related family [Trichomonas vaginalis G3]|eukprot:XP_001309780.1 hypothetical protein [Trichomonas vaginalis G3]